MLTRERVLEVLDYDRETGVFRWKKPISRRVRIGERAGALNTKGYRQINLDRSAYLAHRLVWLLEYAEWPSTQIDHINRCQDDNRISNLRLASQSENKANTPAYRNNTSGFKGVSWHKRRGKWCAHIRVGGTRKSLGYFDSKEEAHSAYLVSAKREFGEFAFS